MAGADAPGRVLLTGQQEGDLAEHGAARHVEKHSTHLDALVLVRIEAGGLGVEDEQALRA
jgi:hypothetical protein